jgi:hypothetical protein
MLMPWGKRLLASRLHKYLDNLQKLYRAIQSVTGAEVIVDSSKFPAYGYILGMLPTIELYITHLIRDPRAVAYSWRRKKLMQPDLEMVQFDPMRSSMQWNVHNLVTEVFWNHLPERYLRLHYEGFIDRPQETIRQILELVGKETSKYPFITKHEVRLDGSHSVSGNPIRFERGSVRLRLDDEWKEKIKRLDMVGVTALTWPLLLKYKYPFVLSH